VPYAALSIATLVAVKSDRSLLVRRKEAKGHGTKKMVEGVFSKGDTCVIVEDVVTSGLSIVETVEVGFCKTPHFHLLHKLTLIYIFSFFRT